MPQFQMLEPGYSFSSELGKAIGGGFGEGLSEGISKYYKGKENQRQMEALSPLFKEFGLPKENVQQLIKSGLKPSEALQVAKLYHDNASSQKKKIEENKKYIFKNLPEVLSRRGIENPEDYERIEKEALGLADKGHDPLDIFGYVSRPAEGEPEMAKALMGSQKTSQDLDQTVTPFGHDIFSKENLEGGLENIKGGVAKGLRPFVSLAQFPLSLLDSIGAAGRKAYYKRVLGFTPEQVEEAENKFYAETKQKEEESGIINPITGTSLTDAYDKLTGNRGQPQNIVERVLQGYPLGPAGIAGQYAAETVASAGLPEPLQEFSNIATFLAAHRIPGKTPQSKAAHRVVQKAEKVASSTGRKAEEVLAEAQSKSGADFAKATAGDAAEINKLSRSITKETPKVAEKVKETPKTVFNAKQAAKERKIFGERLPESPLDIYLKPEKPVAHTAETLAKHEAITKELTPKQDALFDTLNKQRDELRKLQFDVNRAPPEAKPRVEALFHDKQKAIQKTVKDLKDVQYEMKYFKKRQTDEEIAHQIEKSASEFKKEAANPTEEGQKKMARSLELDKQYLERAEKILNRGELPGEISPDTHIKMKKKYADGYREIIKQNKDAMADLKGAKDAESLKKISNIRKENDFLETRLKRLDADVVNQTDKIKAMKGIEPPSGAFYRQQLKSLRNDMDLFKKDFFEARKANRPHELKTQKATKEAFKEVKELGDRLKSKPTIADAEKLAEKAGIPKEEFQKTKVEIEKVAKEKAAAGASEKEIVDSIGEKWDELPKRAEAKKPGLLQKNAIRILKLLGNKVVYQLFAATFAGTLGSSTILGLVKKHGESGRVEDYKKALQSKKGAEVLRIKNQLKADGFSDAKINEFRKRALAEIKLQKPAA